MKLTPFRVVFLINLLVIAGIYTWPYGGRTDIYTAMGWAFFTVVQVLANIVLAMGGSIIEAVNKKSYGLTQAFLINAGLALLISFPLCLTVGQFRS